MRQAYTLHTIGDRAEFLQCTSSAPTALADRASGTSFICADVYMPVSHNTQPTRPTRSYTATMQREDILPSGFVDTSRRTHHTADTWIESQQQYTLLAGTSTYHASAAC